MPSMSPTPMARRSPRWPTPRTAWTCSCTTGGASCSDATRSRGVSIANSRAWSDRSRGPLEGTRRSETRRDLALLCASRVLFLAFLEAKGWLDGDREFLRNAFDARCASGGEVHRRLLDPLFFGTLNTPAGRRAPAARALGRIPFLNGGLFARTPLERRDGRLALHGRDARASSSAVCSPATASPRARARRRGTRRQSTRRCSAARSSRSWPQAIAAPPARSTRPARSSSAWAARDSRPALAALDVPAGVARAACDGTTISPSAVATLRSALSKLRILDPACGSGAFLVHLLERARGYRARGRRRAFRREPPPRRAHALDLRRGRQSHGGVALRAASLALRGHRRRRARPARGAAAAESRPAHSRGRRARRPGVRRVAPDRRAGRARTAARPVRALDAARASGRSRGALDREERRAALLVAARERDAIAARRRDLICAVRSRDLFAARTIPAPAQRDALGDLRSRARQLRRRIAALRVGRAAARSRFPCISPTPPRAAASISSSAIRRGCACTTSRRPCAIHFARTIARSAKPRGCPAPRRPAPAAASRRRSTSRRSSWSGRWRSRAGRHGGAARSRKALALARGRRRTTGARRSRRVVRDRGLGGVARGVRRGRVPVVPARTEAWRRTRGDGRARSRRVVRIARAPSR